MTIIPHMATCSLFLILLLSSNLLHNNDAFAPLVVKTINNNINNNINNGGSFRISSSTYNNNLFHSTKTSSSSTTLNAFPATTDLIMATTTASTTPLSTTTTTVDTSVLWTYFWQVVISNGVPALFTIIVIGFAAFQFRPRRDKMNNKNNMFMSSSSDEYSSTNPIALLYDDLYGEQDQDPFKNKKGFLSFFNNDNNNNRNNKNKQNLLPKNTGIPSKQFIKVTNLNQKYNSFQYSIQSATQSKSYAALQYRQSSLQRALGKTTINLSTWSKLQQIESKYLKYITDVTTQIQQIQLQLTTLAIQDQLQNNMGIDKKNIIAMFNEIDPPIIDVTPTTSSENNETNKTSNNIVLNNNKSNSNINTQKNNLFTLLSKSQKELQEAELEFIKNIINVVGPEHAPSIQAALVGNNGLSSMSLSERPLTRLFGDESTTNNVNSNNRKKKLYVMNFPGDVSASQVSDLREVITSIIIAQKASGNIHNQNKDEQDEALVVLQSGGGTVTGYGLAAAQLMRLKEHGNLKLTICVEQVAASGGYMMACIGDKIIASPFAVLGSIGVISDIPNVYDRLKKEGIEFQTVTAGKFKRTLTPTKKVTKEDYEKSKQDIQEIFILFRDFVKKNRPQLDIESVATGETWFGTAALERNLCDEINTVDDVLTNYVSNNYDVYQVEYQPPLEQTTLGKLLGPATTSTSSTFISSSSNSIANNNMNPLESPIRWFVQTMASAIKEEIASASLSTNVPIEKQYMAMDDTAEKIRSQD